MGGWASIPSLLQAATRVTAKPTSSRNEVINLIVTVSSSYSGGGKMWTMTGDGGVVGYVVKGKGDLA